MSCIVMVNCGYMYSHSVLCIPALCGVCSEKTTALAALPRVKEVAAWDGKDAPEELIGAEEYSLDDLMSD